MKESTIRKKIKKDDAISEGIISNVTLLSDIAKNTKQGNVLLKRIVDDDKKIGIGAKTSTENALQDVSKKSGKKAKVIDISGATISSTKSISGLGGAMKKVSDVSHKSIKSVKAFFKTLKEYSKRKTQDAFKGTATVIDMLRKSVEGVGKILTNASTALKDFMKISVLFALSILSPFFMKGLIRIKQFSESVANLVELKKQDAIKKSADGWKLALVTIGAGVIAIVGALILFRFVPWTHVLALLGFLGALSLITYFGTRNMRGTSITRTITKTISKNSNNNSTKMKAGFGLSNSLSVLAGSLSLLVLAIVASTMVNWTKTLPMMIFLAGIATVSILATTGKRKEGGSVNKMSGVLGFALGLGILVLAIVAFQLIPYKAITKVLVFMAAIALIVTGVPVLMGGLGKKLGGSLPTSKVDNPGKQMMLFAAGLAVLGLATWAITTIMQGKWAGAWAFLGFVAVAMLIFSVFKEGGIINIFKGRTLDIKQQKSDTKETAKNMAIMVAGFAAFALLLIIIDRFIQDPDTLWTKMGVLGALVIGTALVYAALNTFDKVMGDIKSSMVKMLLMAVGIAGFVLTIKFLSTINVEGIWEKMAIVGVTIIAAAGIAIGLAAITTTGIGAAAIFIGIGIMVALAAPIIIMALALKLVASIKFREGFADNFTQGLSGVVKAIASLSFLDVVKAAAKSMPLIPIMAVASLAAEALQKIYELPVGHKPEAMDTFKDTLTTFINALTDVIKATDGKVTKDMKPGLEALEKIVGIGAGLANIIQSFANMSFDEYKYDEKRGELVLVGKRPITQEELDRVGPAVNKLIDSLIKPLGDIAEKKINKKGLKNISLIGEMYKPIFESISSLTGGQSATLLTDYSKSAALGANMNMLIDKLLSIADKMSNTKQPNKESLKVLNGFLYYINQVDWNKVNSGMDKLQQNTVKMAKAINSMDLKKVVMVNDTVKFLTNLKINDRQRQDMELLIKLMEGMSEHQELVARSTEELSVKVEKQTNVITQDIKRRTEDKSKGITNESLESALNTHVGKIVSEIRDTRNNVYQVDVVDNEPIRK